jgi:hypothetical protein
MHWHLSGNVVYRSLNFSSASSHGIIRKYVRFRLQLSEPVLENIADADDSHELIAGRMRRWVISFITSVAVTSGAQTMTALVISSETVTLGNLISVRSEAIGEITLVRCHRRRSHRYSPLRHQFAQRAAALRVKAAVSRHCLHDRTLDSQDVSYPHDWLRLAREALKRGTSILFRQMALIMTSKARDHADSANFACSLASPNHCEQAYKIRGA